MSIALSSFDFFIVLFLSAFCRRTARLNASRWIQCANAHIRNMFDAHSPKSFFCSIRSIALASRSTFNDTSRTALTSKINIMHSKNQPPGTVHPGRQSFVLIVGFLSIISKPFHAYRIVQMFPSALQGQPSKASISAPNHVITNAPFLA